MAVQSGRSAQWTHNWNLFWPFCVQKNPHVILRPDNFFLEVGAQISAQNGATFCRYFPGCNITSWKISAKSCPHFGPKFGPQLPKKKYPDVKLHVDFFERKTAKINSSSGHLRNSTQSVTHGIDIDKLEALVRHPKWNGRFLSPTTRSFERGPKGSFPTWAPTMCSIDDGGERFSVRQCSVLSVGHGGRNPCSGRPWIWST